MLLPLKVILHVNLVSNNFLNEKFPVTYITYISDENINIKNLIEKLVLVEFSKVISVQIRLINVLL